MYVKQKKRKEENMLNNKPKTIKVSKLSKVINDTTKSFKIENFDLEEMKPIDNILNLNFIVTHVYGICKYFAYDPNSKIIADLYEIRINEKYENKMPVVEEILFTNLSYNTFKYDEMTNMIHLNNEMFIGSKVVFSNLHQLIIALRTTSNGDIHYRNNQQAYMQQHNPYQHVPIYNNVQQPYGRTQVHNPYKQYTQPSFGYNQQPFIRETNNESIHLIKDDDSYLNNESINLEDKRKVILDNLKKSLDDIMDALPKL